MKTENSGHVAQEWTWNAENQFLEKWSECKDTIFQLWEEMDQGVYEVLKETPSLGFQIRKQTLSLSLVGWQMPIIPVLRQYDLQPGASGLHRKTLHLVRLRSGESVSMWSPHVLALTALCRTPSDNCSPMIYGS